MAARSGVVKRPQESVPQTPPMPWAAMAPSGSSTPMRSTKTSVAYIMVPAMKPMTMEAHGATKAHGAVMATRAAMAPLPPIPTSTCRLQVAHAHRSEDPGGRGEVRRKGDVRDVGNGGHRRSRVETPPADPEYEDTEDRKGHVVSRDIHGAAVVVHLSSAAIAPERWTT